MYFLAGVLAGALAVWVFGERTIGQVTFRKGLRHAAQIARERGDVSLHLAPKGNLQVGLVRSRMAEDVALAIGEAARRS